MTVIKIRQVGKGLGVELPAEVIERLHLDVGDNISLEKESQGGYRLIAKGDQFTEQMTLIEDYMHEEDA